MTLPGDAFFDPNPFRAGWDCYGEIRTRVGTYHVRLNYRWGPFRAVLEVWKDVRPALGGLMGRRRFRSNDEARAEFDRLVDDLRETAGLPPLIPKPVDHG